MLSNAWLGALTPSLANFASSARLTIVETAVSLVDFPTTSSDAIKTLEDKLSANEDEDEDEDEDEGNHGNVSTLIYIRLTVGRISIQGTEVSLVRRFKNSIYKSQPSGLLPSTRTVLQSNEYYLR
eukprot:TRINITY_DN9444_c0_g1_i6.p1 TRINITY_DN9444_c0_g1~~TRINITY_DN9444_c0_g1_i6.p1  ORF type:complete len:125 (+),score=5.36 TRINITY_DN9444_c0_g1_i6:136-510(+)